MAECAAERGHALPRTTLRTDWRDTDREPFGDLSGGELPRPQVLMDLPTGAIGEGTEDVGLSYPSLLERGEHGPLGDGLFDPPAQDRRGPLAGHRTTGT